MSHQPPTKAECIIERMGPLVRIGVEGEWVEMLEDHKTLSRQELYELIVKMDKGKPRRPSYHCDACDSTITTDSLDHEWIKAKRCIRCWQAEQRGGAA